MEKCWATKKRREKDMNIDQTTDNNNSLNILYNCFVCLINKLIVAIFFFFFLWDLNIIIIWTFFFKKQALTYCSSFFRAIMSVIYCNKTIIMMILKEVCRTYCRRLFFNRESLKTCSEMGAFLIFNCQFGAALS